MLGLFIFVEGSLRVNREVVDRLYELSKKDLSEQVEIADTGDASRALRYLKPIEDAESIPEIAYLIREIHGEA